MMLIGGVFSSRTTSSTTQTVTGSNATERNTVAAAYDTLTSSYWLVAVMSAKLMQSLTAVLRYETFGPHCRVPLCGPYSTDVLPSHKVSRRPAFVNS